MELAPGTVIAGKYRVQSVVGRGATGIVVAATHMTLGQLVAVKILHGSSPDAAGRFEREARLAARLKGEHVAHVLDAGRLETGEPFIVMEFLDGTDLSVLLRERGAMSVPDASACIMQACVGLAEAHALGMVHRDVKPANIFLTKGPGGLPLVKVLDFGITKAAPKSAESVNLRTQAGALLGTPRYMSPEQLMSSDDVDARSDVWSIGVVLYTLLMGRPPFDGNTVAEIFRAVLDEPMAPLDPARVPREMCAIFERCLRKRREERYSNLAELAYDLAPFAGADARSSVHRIAAHLGVALPGGRPKGRNRLLVAGIIALSIAVGASVVLVVRRHRHVAQRSAAASASASAGIEHVAFPTPAVAATVDGPTPVEVAASAPRALETAHAATAAVAGNPKGIEAARRKFFLAHDASCVEAWAELQATPGFVSTYDLDTARADCTMLAGHCKEGRAALRRLLATRPESLFVQAHSDASAIDGSVRSSAVRRCPVSQLSKEELVTHKTDAIRSAMWSHDPARATKIADEIVPLLQSYDRRGINNEYYEATMHELCDAYRAAPRCEAAKRYCAFGCTANGGHLEPCLSQWLGGKCP